MKAHGNRSANRSARAGFTLLELILVLVLISILLGAGLGMFASLDFGREQAAGLVKNALRSAENTAIASQAPARVSIDRSLGSFRPEGMRVVGTWRFEDRSLDGGNGIDGRAAAELFTRDGYIGDALRFTDRRGELAEIPVHEDPAFDLRQGFTIDCVLRLEGTGGGRVLTIADHLRLEVGQGGALRGSFRVRSIGESGRAAAGGVVVVRSNPGMLVPWRWTRVRLSFDRVEFVLFVDGVRVAAVPQSSEVWRVDGPLVLSDERLPFPGSIDDLVVQAAWGEEEVVLPESVTIVSAPEVIRFAAGGGLDRREHPAPAEIVLGFEDGTRRTLTVGAYGTVE
ncbi:MAG TPA: prepilin-type N-terminal cleavage/methylation domain-containing protein [Planctomycetes bacterium]|nr:prepilin-type N-terminal cleavage/methylation domain-containing protein [Planctomycetota bacterium]